MPQRFRLGRNAFRNSEGSRMRRYRNPRAYARARRTTLMRRSIRRSLFSANKKGLYYFTRSFHGATTWTPGPTSFDNSKTFNVSLNQLPNFTELTALFDQYKIIGATITFHYARGNTQNQDSVIIKEMPTIFTCTDLDSTASIGFDDILQRKYKRHDFGNESNTLCRFQIPPYVKVQLAGQNTTVLTANEPKRSPWIDTANNDYKHGNLFVALQGSPTIPYELRYVIDVRMMCKGVI